MVRFNRRVKEIYIYMYVYTDGDIRRGGLAVEDGASSPPFIEESSAKGRRIFIYRTDFSLKSLRRFLIRGADSD